MCVLFFYNTPTRDDFLPVTRFLKLFHILPTVVVAVAGGTISFVVVSVVGFFLLLLLDTLAEISDLLKDEKIDFLAAFGCAVAAVASFVVVRDVGDTLLVSAEEERPKVKTRAENFFTSDLIVDFGCCCCAGGVDEGVFGSGFVAGEEEEDVVECRLAALVVFGVVLLLGAFGADEDDLQKVLLAN